MPKKLKTYFKYDIQSKYLGKFVCFTPQMIRKSGQQKAFPGFSNFKVKKFTVHIKVFIIWSYLQERQQSILNPYWKMPKRLF